MTVTAVTPPVPPNGDMARAMFAYLGVDPLGTDANMQALLNFCSTQGANVLFMDVYAYLGGGNWSSTHLTRMQLLCDMAHKSGIKVIAYAGNYDFGISQSWVLANIVAKLQKYQSMATSVTHRFDGVVYDVEYWTHEGAPDNYAPATHCPALCDLMRATRALLNVPVGCFATFYLKDSTATRATFSYQGKTAQDGEFLMDNADFVVVGDYRNHAADGGTESGPGIDTLHAPWNTYAASVGKNFGLYAGVETINVSPAYTTFFGKTKAAMETELTTVAGAFKSGANSAYLGAAVDSYDGWKAMT